MEFFHKPKPSHTKCIITAVVAALASAAACFFVGRMFCPTSCTKANAATMNAQEYTARRTVDKLMLEQAFLMRQLMISKLADTQDVKAVEDRLAKNSGELKQLFESAYGPDFTAKFNDILTHEMQSYGILIDAAKARNEQQFATAANALKESAQNMATLFKDKTDHNLENTILAQLALRSGELEARQKQNWSEDIDLFGQVMMQTLAIANSVADGLVKNLK